MEKRPFPDIFMYIFPSLFPSTGNVPAGLIFRVFNHCKGEISNGEQMQDHNRAKSKLS